MWERNSVVERERGCAERARDLLGKGQQRNTHTYTKIFPPPTLLTCINVYLYLLFPVSIPTQILGISRVAGAVTDTYTSCRSNFFLVGRRVRTREEESWPAASKFQQGSKVSALRRRWWGKNAGRSILPRPRVSGEWDALCVWVCRGIPVWYHERENRPRTVARIHTPGIRLAGWSRNRLQQSLDIGELFVT